MERAAREKVAADLAQDVGVKVPPVLLYERNDGPRGEESRCCVSLVMFPRQLSWGQVSPLLASNPPQSTATHILPLVANAAAEGFAFDTWVGQGDHGDHPHNIIFGFNPEDLADSDFYFLDYSFALGARGIWAGAGATDVTAAPFPPLMRQRLDAAHLSSVVARIEALPDSQIGDVVHRIPQQFLDRQEAALIVKGLSSRKRLLREALQDVLETN